MIQFTNPQTINLPASGAYSSLDVGVSPNGLPFTIEIKVLQHGNPPPQFVDQNLHALANPITFGPVSNFAMTQFNHGDQIIVKTTVSNIGGATVNTTVEHTFSNNPQIDLPTAAGSPIASGYAEVFYAEFNII